MTQSRGIAHQGIKDGIKKERKETAKKVIYTPGGNEVYIRGGTNIY